MAMTMAKIHLRGRAGSDPVFFEAKSGKKFSRVSVAVDSGQQDNKKTSWFSVLFNEKWGLENWKKGDLVDIEGDIRTSVYEKDGEKRLSVTVFPQNVLNISLAERNKAKKDAEPAKDEEFDPELFEEEPEPDIDIQ
jgi:single-stranded DNA-binding protein